MPQGVPFRALGELGKFYGGITGKSKDDFVDGNAKFITYKNVYSNMALDVNVSDKVKILTTKQHCLNLEVNARIANYKYIYYCVCNQYKDLLEKKEGARGDLSVSRIMSLKIYVPNLEKQDRIVSILDQFDTLCNDISAGLPAEIEAR